MHKVKFDTDVSLLVSSLYVDMKNAVDWFSSKHSQSRKVSASVSASQSEPVQVQASQAASQDEDAQLKQPHPVAMLIPGFDAVQSSLSPCQRSV